MHMVHWCAPVNEEYTVTFKRSGASDKVVAQIFARGSGTVPAEDVQVPDAKTADTEYEKNSAATPQINSRSGSPFSTM